MGIFNEIEKYGEYFHSIRLHDSILLLDLKLPTDWQIKNILTSFGSTTQIKINDTTNTHTLISFYCPFIRKETETLVNDVDKIIKWNKDREEKTHLLDLKILELKKVFDTNNLDSLRNINFDFKEELKDINLENGEKLKMARE